MHFFESIFFRIIVRFLCLFFLVKKKTKLSYMIIIFYDNIASFKKSKLTYKLILSKQKQDSISNPVLVSASICSEWLVAFLTAMSHILWSLNSTSQKWRAFPETSAERCTFLPVFQPNVPFLSVRSRILVSNHLLSNFQPCQV